VTIVAKSRSVTVVEVNTRSVGQVVVSHERAFGVAVRIVTTLATDPHATR
jgi:hypothetical protein